jgi:exodeoxyribonuclease VII large subunit
MEARGWDDSSIEEWDDVFTVTEINEAIRHSLETEFPSVSVLGEIANFTAHSSGHLYFSLRDESNLIRTVVFRRYVENLDFEPENGKLVIASGRISHYGGRGQTQLLASRMIPAGRGGMELEFRRLLQKLMHEGLTAETTKRPIPRYPERIIVITSETGAVIRDIIDTLKRRWPVAEIVHIGVAVQGPEAARTIVNAFEVSNRLRGVDAVILARGGGSIEDLWTFNTEEVARAVAGSVHPVITGIGHEVDTTVVDYVSDMRAATPTAAAELVAPSIDDVRARMNDTLQHLTTAYRESHERRLRLLEYLLRSSSFPALIHRLEQAELKLDDAVGRLGMWWHASRFEYAGALETLHVIHAAVVSSQRARETHITRLRERVAAENPGSRISTAQGMISKLRNELALRTTSAQVLRWSGVDGNIRTLENLHPRNVLKRGYTFCTAADGETIVGRVGDVVTDENMTVNFYDGRAVCRVIEKQKGKPWLKR